MKLRYLLLLTYILSTWFWLYLGASFFQSVILYLLILPFMYIVHSHTCSSCSFTEEDLKDLLGKDDEDDSNRKSAH